MQKIDPYAFCCRSNDLWAKQTMLLTCGDYKSGEYNTMTVGWGFFGVMWGRPAVQTVVRPVRYTFEFMQRFREFTLCAFPPAQKKVLQLMGSTSGRDTDKIAASGLTPAAAQSIAAPCFQEAELVLECRSIYKDDFKPECFLDPLLERHYPQKDYHRFFIGELLEIRGTDKYSSGE